MPAAPAKQLGTVAILRCGSPACGSSVVAYQPDLDTLGHSHTAPVLPHAYVTPNFVKS